MSLWNWFRGRGTTESTTNAASSQPEKAEPAQREELDPVELEITDVLDLHSFPPRDAKDVVLGYLDAAHERGFRSLRIIHGRGTGTQRRMVRTLLDRDPRVKAFADAPPEAGGWGATVVELS